MTIYENLAFAGFSFLVDFFFSTYHLTVPVEKVALVLLPICCTPIASAQTIPAKGFSTKERDYCLERAQY